MTRSVRSGGKLKTTRVDRRSRRVVEHAWIGGQSLALLADAVRVLVEVSVRDGFRDSDLAGGREHDGPESPRTQPVPRIRGHALRSIDHAAQDLAVCLLDATSGPAAGQLAMAAAAISILVEVCLHGHHRGLDVRIEHVLGAPP